MDERRDFTLPEADVDYLNSLEKSWETFREGGNQWLLIHSWDIPEGYNVKSTTLALLIPPSFPDVQIDMFYFADDLSCKSGKAIKALSHETINGKRYQRWSRHRTPQNPWRPGIDDLRTHLTLVDDCLAREVEQ